VSILLGIGVFDQRTDCAGGGVGRRALTMQHGRPEAAEFSHAIMLIVAILLLVYSAKPR
jgi:hypothetical protein